MWWLYTILAIIALLIITVLARTFTFKQKKQIEPDTDTINFDKEKAIASLQKLVRCKTVSYYDKSLEDDNEFQKLIDLIPQLYPNVKNTCTFSQLPDRALLFLWKGKSSQNPAVMMAHYDVVPVEEEMWEKPPFEAIIEDDVMWGRGTLDTKVTFNAILSAADELIKKGFVPENDIYFAFSGDEEVNGKGAENIVQWFKDNKITPYLVLDEGGGVVKNVFPGVKAPCGLIGIAEKGMMNLTFKTNSSGGHASAPKPHTPIGILARACKKVEDNPFPMHLTTPAKEMFNILGRHSTFVFKMIFANMWLFKGVLDLIAKKGGREMNALLRTTVAFTQAQGSTAPNVIPPNATLVANMRLNPKDSVESALNRIKETIKDENIELIVGSHMEPSPISEVYCPQWDKVSKAVASTWRGCIVAPYLMVQCSDSRHYKDISNHVYKFSAMDLTKEERATIHGNNEKIRLEALERAVEFYIRLLRIC